jgi:transaldolase / glucose-6-phosphate isomerase
MDNAIQGLHELGQSLWYDNIQRGFIENGELAGMIARGDIRGVTSNPSIFQNAIANSNEYDTALTSMAWSGLSSEQILDALTVEDIRAAADLFRELFERSGGGDGYVSLEVNPNLAQDTEGTIAEARRLWELVDRPNLMVKIPATQAGIPAIRSSIAQGINVNVTLIFSLTRYGEVMDAYLTGLEERLKSGLPLDHIASVASFFVSRVDSKVDKRLDQIIKAEESGVEEAGELLGKAAVANAKLAYEQFSQTFSSERWMALEEKGARMQRPLWASTSTKNPAYSDVKYVEDLIGSHTVNTVPQNTLEAFAGHGRAEITIEADLDGARQALAALERLGISMDQVTQELEEEGVKAFADSFNSLLETIESRRVAAQNQLGDLKQVIPTRVDQLHADKAAIRLYAKDASLWISDQEQAQEIGERLGWLDLPQASRQLIPGLQDFAAQVQADGFRHVLLIGMGGSSLAAEVMSSLAIYGFLETSDAGLPLTVLDTTDPAQILLVEEKVREAPTLYIVSSKSGDTVEVRALADTFWAMENRLGMASGGEKVGDRFIAITDPGTSLEKLAQERRFRQVFLADPTVGGRNSALSAFGLVPAALLGIDLNALLERAEWMAKQCRPVETQPVGFGSPTARNPGLVLGAVLGEAAQQGRDKLTLLADGPVAPLGVWIEQLIAESTGKDGKGILPVDQEPLVNLETYGDDRFFIHLRADGELDAGVEALLQAGQPVIRLNMENGIDLGAEFYRWQVATAIASSILGVNSFNQPDVQDSKRRTQEKLKSAGTAMVAEIAPEAFWEEAGIRFYTTQQSGIEQPDSTAGLIDRFLEQAKPGDYLALNAYLPPFPEIEAMLRRLRMNLRERSRLATTLGFGPRYLHSTGQIHKGGANNGLFIKIIADAEQDIEIPGQGITFGMLEQAQAFGDYEALAARERRVLGIHLSHWRELERLLEN